MKQGPNVKKLIIARMSALAVPSGGGIQAAVEFLSSPEKILASAREATAWVAAAIDLVRAARDNPYRDADDETVAGVILAKTSPTRNFLPETLQGVASSNRVQVPRTNS